MAARRTDAQIFADWNAPGLQGLEFFLADVKPRILHADNRYRPIDLEPWQWAILEEALATVIAQAIDAGIILDDDDEEVAGQLAFALLLLIMPRRHSKSTLFALIILWLICSRPNLTVACLGNNEQHSQRVQLRLLRRVIRATPALLQLFGGETALGKTEIRCKATGGLIVQVTPTTQSAYGDRFNVLWVSDFHAALTWTLSTPCKRACWIVSLG